MNLNAFKISLGEVLQSFKQKSAVYSLTWMSLFVGLPCIYLSHNKDGSIGWPYFILGSIPIAVFVIAYFYFMFKDPARLHSEEFQTKNRALEIAESKGGGIEFDRVALTEISNPFPEHVKLPTRNEGRQS